MSVKVRVRETHRKSVCVKERERKSVFHAIKGITAVSVGNCSDKSHLVSRGKGGGYETKPLRVAPENNSSNFK